MEILSINRGTALTIMYIFLTLIVIADIVILVRIVKKRNGGMMEKNRFYYLSQFIVFGGLMFLLCGFTTFDWKRDLLTSTVSATIFTLCLFLSDRKNKKNQKGNSNETV